MRCKVCPEHAGLSLAAVGVGGTVVKMAVPVLDWPSGFVTVTSLVPHIAPTVDTSTVSCVGVSKARELTETLPLMATAMCFWKPGPPVSGPGSKNSDPETDAPATIIGADV